MPWLAIRNELQTLLEAVPGIGVVHRYLRLITSDNMLRLLGVPEGLRGYPINLWMHSRIGFEQSLLTTHEKLTRHTWLIRGFYTVNDEMETEATFQTILNGIANGIGADITLSEACEQVTELAVLPANDIPHVMLPPGDGGQLCHFADIRLVIQDRLDR